MIKRLLHWLWPWRIWGVVWLVAWGAVLWGLGRNDQSGALRKQLEELYPWAVSRKLSNASNWMGIFLQGRKIGYLHSEQKVLSEGYQITQDSTMLLDVLGTKQRIAFHSVFWLGARYQLRRFTFQLDSPLSRFSAKGRARKSLLIIDVSMAGIHRTIRLPYRPAMLASLLRPTIALQKPSPGKKIRSLVFQPQTLSYQASLIEVLGYEPLQLKGKSYRALKMQQKAHGSVITVWLDEKGQTLKEQSDNGMLMLRQSPHEAVREVWADATVLRATRIPFPYLLRYPFHAPHLRLKLQGKGLEAFPALSQRRQRFVDGVLSVTKEVLAKKRKTHALPRKMEPASRPSSLASRPTSRKGPTSQKASNEEALRMALQATKAIPSNHPKIRALAKRITQGTSQRIERLRKLAAWLFSNLRKQSNLGDVGVLETLQRKSGDSNQHAHLLAALARSLDIPCEVVSGLVYREKSFFFHVWNECAIRSAHWVSLDAMWGQIPADVTHLAFVRGEKEQQIPFLRILGKISIRPVQR